MKKQKGVIDIAMIIGLAVLVAIMASQPKRNTGGINTPNHNPDQYITEDK